MKKRPLMWWIICFILGIILSEKLEWTAFTAVLIFFVAIKPWELYWKYLYPKERDDKIALYRKGIRNSTIVIICAVFASLGYLYTAYFVTSRTMEISNYITKEHEIFGTVFKEPKRGQYYYEYFLKDVIIDGKEISSNIRFQGKGKFEFGEKLKIIGKVEVPKGARNKGGFDYKKYLMTEDTFGTVKAENVQKMEYDKSLINEMEDKILFWGHIIREKCKEFAAKSLPEIEAGIERALIVGDEEGISDEINEKYIQSGMIHLLVVSGSHVAALILLAVSLLRLFGINGLKGKYAIIFLLLIYIVVTGVTPSIIRAGIAAIIILAGEIIGRQNDSLTTITLVGFLILIFNPMQIYGVGFELSFAGAGGIIIAYPIVCKWLRILPKVLKEGVAVTVAAQMFLLPIMIYNFNKIYFGGIASGMIATGLTWLIMMIGIVAFIIYLVINPIGLMINKVNLMLIDLLNLIANVFSGIEFLQVTVITPNVIEIIFYYLLLLYGLGLIKIEKKKLIWGIISMLILIIGIRLLPKDMTITAIDVGHGDSIAITAPNRSVMLIDTGPKVPGTNGPDLNHSCLAPLVPLSTSAEFLLDKGFRHVDMLVLTHFDEDHTGSAISIIQNLNVNKVAISINSKEKEEYKQLLPYLEKRNIETIFLEEGMSFSFDNAEFYVLSPKESDIASENNDSVCLMMEYLGTKTLFPGDLEEEGEEALIKSGKSLEADILKLGHHGSITSSSENFIRAVEPEIAIISVGTRFKSIPSEIVLKRMESIDAKVYRTDKMGAVEVIIPKNNNIKVITHLTE